MDDALNSKIKRPWDAIVWWEIRRIPFNIIIFIAGIVSITIMEIIGPHFIVKWEDPVEPMAILFVAIPYAVGVNLCYTLGWITELFWSEGDTTRTEMLRYKLFLIGTVFSIAVTSLPVILIPLAWIIWGTK